MSDDECCEECEPSNAWNEGLGCAVIILAIGIAVALIIVASTYAHMHGN